MTKKDLFNILQEKWYTAGGVALEDIEPHIENLKKVDEIVPPGPRFYLVANFSNYQYEFVGRGQKLLTGYDN